MTILRVKQATTADEIADINILRAAVFIREQGVPPNIESDDFDAIAYHAIALLSKTTVGTGRLVITEDGTTSIGRMAVDISHRRVGIGRQVLLFLEFHAIDLGSTLITLHAQSQAVDFYLKNGYLVDGESFQEAGIEHVPMRKYLSREPGNA